MPTGSIEWRDFSKGWIPSDDLMNGRKNGLLRMDNLWLNEKGVLEVVRATAKASSQFPSAPSSCYSKMINGQKYRYVFYNGTVVRDLASDNFAVPTTIINAAGGSGAAFGSGFGQVFVSSGTGFVKDDGTTVRNWGINAPAAGIAGYTIAASPSKFIADAGNSGNWTAAQGTGLSTAATTVTATADATTFVEILQDSYSAPMDSTALSSGVATPQDYFSIPVQIGDTTQLLLTRVELLLVTPGAGVNTVSDYFWFEWPVTNTTNYNIGLNNWSTLICQRSDFQRVGSNAALGFNTIQAIRVTFYCASAITNTVMTAIQFYGGSNGNVTGLVQYMQTNCYSNGTYVGESGPGPVSSPINVPNSQVTITPYTTGIDSQVNLCKFYRRGVPGGGGLQDFYYVGSCAPGSTFTDNVSDILALQTNITLNQFLLPISGLGTPVISISDEYFERMLLLTATQLIITEELNPDSYDPREQVTTASLVGEQNLWITKVSNSSLLLGTTADIYELSGTFLLQPDGTLDYFKRALGVKQPPISQTVRVDSNVLYYVAADGIRQVYFGQSTPVSQELGWLFKGVSRYGVPGVLTLGANTSFTRMTSYKNQLYTIVQHTDLTLSIFVYDLIAGYWYRVYLNPNFLFTEEDGTLIATFPDGYLRVLDAPSYLLDGTTPQQINGLLAFQDGGTPFQRKDLFSLRFGVDTGGSVVNVYVGVDGGSPIFLGTLNSNGWSQQYITVNGTAVDLGQRYNLQFTDVNGAGVNFFRLTEIALHFDVRPLPLPYFRIEPTNFNAAGRKRLFELPLVIDTLGAAVSVTPYLDGVAWPTQQFTTTNKTTVSYKFPAANVVNLKSTIPPYPTEYNDTYATDVWIAIQAAAGNLFEFYQVLEPKVIDVLPDPITFYREQYTNLGSVNRKRWAVIAFIIDTRNSPVFIVPFVDGTPYAGQYFTTQQKTTVFYRFEEEVLGAECCIVAYPSNLQIPFEFYGMDLKNCVTEELPIRTDIHIIPYVNFGNPGRDRVRALNFIINTFGHNVEVYANVDGVAQPVQIVCTTEKQTATYYFTTDSFGSDYELVIGGGGVLFEYYEPLTPVIVESTPALRIFDQVGPFELNRMGALYKIRLRLITEGVLITYNVFMDDVLVDIANNTFDTNPKLDNIYEFRLPRGITGSVCRVELTGDEPFTRLSAEILASESGLDVDEPNAKWRAIK